MGTNETTLLPCPFCGAYASMRQGARFGHWVQCDKCGAGHPFAFDTEDGAAAAWNSRAPEEARLSIAIRNLPEANYVTVSRFEDEVRDDLADRERFRRCYYEAAKRNDRLRDIVLELCKEVENMEGSDAVIWTERARRIASLIEQARAAIGEGEACE